MAQRGTHDINDYMDDYERTMQDYSEMGSLWAEMVFGDDFEAMKALYGRQPQPTDNYVQPNHEDERRSYKRR